MGIALGGADEFRRVVPLTAIANQAAGADFAKFTAPFDGIAHLFLSLPTQSVVNLMVNPQGGMEGNAGAINSGQPIPAGQPQHFTFPVSGGSAYALQVATAQTGTLYVSIGIEVP
jgi:hypothetical protein